MIITQTPLRCSLLGGGSDLPHFADRHGSLVVGCAIRQFVYVSARELPPFHPHSFRVVYHATELVNEVGEIKHPVVRACLEEYPSGGVEITYQSDLPGRSGMGSSSAFLVGLLQALASLAQTPLTTPRLYRKAVGVEQERLRESVGYQDSAWAAFGGLSAMEFLPGTKGEAVVERLPVPPGEFESHCLLAFPGARTFDSSGIAATYARSPVLEPHARVMLNIAREGKGALLTRDWEKCGHLLDRAWAEKRKLSGVSNAQTDLLYDRCRLAGAWGGKQLGAGGGGMLLFMCPPDRRERVLSVLGEAGCLEVPFFVCQWGSRIIHAD